MGNHLTVDNQVCETNVVTIRLAGSKNILVKETFNEQSKNTYSVLKSFFNSKTFIVTVNDKVSRAVGNNKCIRIMQSEEGQLKIIVIPKQYQLESSLEQIIENEESNLNWNITTDKSVNNEHMKAANDVINLMNNFVTVLGTGIGNVVRMIPANSAVVNYGSKYVSDILINYMKTATIKSKSERDVHSMELFKRIHHQLIAVSRAINIDYVYLTEEKKIDNEKAFDFLHNQMMKITNTEMLPFLEECNMEESIVIYIFAISLVTEICEKMNTISDNRPHNKLEQGYMSIFSKNLHEIWHNFLEKTSEDVKITMSGCLIKTACLKYRSGHVYKVKSFSKSRAQDRINDIKEAFIMNMKYQMDFLYGHPELVINKCQEFANILETSCN